jgi:hypothetical protein
MALSENGGYWIHSRFYMETDEALDMDVYDVWS